MRIKNWLAASLMVLCLGGVMNAVAFPQTTNAAIKTCTSNFLGFPAWYRGLIDESTCNVLSPDGKPGPSGKINPTLTEFIWHIGLNVVEIGLVAVIYISALFTLYGGFMFMTSQGKPDNAAKARMTMLDAIIGLVISFAAVIFVNFIIGRLGG